jgi:UrcA family protein
MTKSIFRFGFPLAMALAAAGAATAAQQSDQTPGVQNEPGKLQRTIVGLSDAGTPIERFWLNREVNIADLDLTTVSGSAEFLRRVTEAAKEACAQLRTEDPADLSDMDNDSCIRTATDSALKQAKAMTGQRRTSTTQVSSTG